LQENKSDQETISAANIAEKQALQEDKSDQETVSAANFAEE